MILRSNVECVEYWISGRENRFMNILFFRNFSLLILEVSSMTFPLTYDSNTLCHCFDLSLISIHQEAARRYFLGLVSLGGRASSNCVHLYFI